MNFLELAVSRRSVNFFDSSVKITNDILKKIIDLAGLAPSASNTQPWRLIIVNDSQTKMKLKEIAFNQPKISEASATLILLGDTEAYKRTNPIYKSFINKKYMDEKAFDGYMDMMESLYANLHTPEQFAIRNASLFGMSLMYSAKLFGWDTHPMIGFNPAKLKIEFNIPDKFIPVMLIAVGKFDATKKLLPRNDRYSFEDIVSFNSFSENTSPKFENMFMTNNNSVTLKEKTFELAGKLPELNSTAPDFTVLDNNLQTVSLDSLIDKPLVISAVPSIDTPICNIQTKKFNESLLSLKEKINFITISCDTPFAQKRFCSEEALQFPVYSDSKNNFFAINYGVLILELCLCARSVFIIGRDKKIIYKQLVNEISSEPDYNDVINSIKKILIVDFSN
ncbi:MAG TPA: thiol peroxidase [bacterium]|nr:thiol peroxidase [bacterium]